MGAIHHNFARKKVGDTEKRAKHEVYSAYNEMNVVRSFDRTFFLCSDFSFVDFEVTAAYGESPKPFTRCKGLMR